MENNDARHICPHRKKCPSVNASTVNPQIKVLMIQAKIKNIKPKLFFYPRNICCKAPLFGAAAYIRFPAIRDNSSWRVGWIQACQGLTCKNYYSGNEWSSWEIPDSYQIISDADGSNMPFYGNKRESILLRGPRQSVWYGSVAITDQLLSDISLKSKRNNDLQRSAHWRHWKPQLDAYGYTVPEIPDQCLSRPLLSQVQTLVWHGEDDISDEMSKAVATKPTLVWAQTNDYVMVTIATDDIERGLEVKFDKQSFHISAPSASSPDSIKYEVTLELFKEIVPEKSTYLKHRRWILQLQKTNDEKFFWSRLQKEKTKLPFVSVDWQRWKDEDELENTIPQMPGGGDFDFSNMDFGNVDGGGLDYDPNDLPDMSNIDGFIIVVNKFNSNDFVYLCGILQQTNCTFVR
ncbi:hypothetical protein GJ496_004051 [Pomphorhynchus laevis]|nr:hypothetical protein GJ496_004051 [Pomphorhynchus laevis]